MTNRVLRNGIFLKYFCTFLNIFNFYHMLYMTFSKPQEILNPFLWCFVINLSQHPDIFRKFLRFETAKQIKGADVYNMVLEIFLKSGNFARMRFSIKVRALSLFCCPHLLESVQDFWGTKVALSHKKSLR